MERFKYKAISDTGRTTRGVVAAANEIDLYNQLQSAGLQLIDCKSLSKKSWFGISPSLKRVKLREIIQFFIHMEQMQSAGVPILDSLADIRDSTENSRLRDVLSEMHRDVSEGMSLAEAMAKHPKIFISLYLSLVKAGEATGDLSASYRELIKYLKWVDLMHAKVRKATRYPIIIMLFVILTIVVMMGYVVPQIVGFIINMKMDLPFYTRWLIDTSAFFQAYLWFLLAAPFVFYFTIRTLCKASEEFAYRVDSTILRMPFVGSLMRKIAIARYCQTFGALFGAGVDIISALKAARETVNNKVIIEALERVERNIQAGQPVSEAFNMSGEFPSMVVRMLKIGEESGNLTTVLDQVSEFYTRDVDEAVEGMVAMIEPILTAVLGGIILWIAAGVFGPIYASFEHMDL